MRSTHLKLLHQVVCIQGHGSDTYAQRAANGIGNGGNAGVALAFTGLISNPYEGRATLSTSQAADLLAGRWHVNLHTAIFPAGEIRG